MLGNMTSMVFELWLNATRLECNDHPQRERVRKDAGAVMKYLRQSEKIHGFAFREDVFDPVQRFLPWCSERAAILLPKDGLLGGRILVSMRNEANEEKHRLDTERDEVGAMVLDVYFYFIMWLYDGWSMKPGSTKSLKSIVRHLAGLM